ncbi:DUF4198 domain-containing protein [Anthocerotibacter panamensis]|uniref:DUF4198 domain-containing protein n=1 Tax=Anthocerotibacter panamensis TaxID=2857077 RepID=UPI001C4079C5|nr:DUF4198 domain-containing protein [Anthocerotibacter panamensis]
MFHPCARFMLPGALLLALACGAYPAWSHDYWLQPSQFKPEVGVPVQIHLYYGDGFKPEGERPFQQKRTPAYSLYSATTTQDLAQTTPDQHLPLSDLSFPRPGSYLLALDRNAQNIQLPAPKFNAYLQEEGLTDILRLRARKGQTKSPGRERYARNIKAIIQVGEPVEETPLRTLDKTIEMLPQQNPYALKAGDPFSLQVRFAGKALVNRQVNAYILNQGKVSHQDARTDPKGMVTFRLKPGVWLIRLVHMRPCQQACQGVDWESFWSSLTFAL